jgi:phosphoglucomutase/phosphomannomutase
MSHDTPLESALDRLAAALEHGELTAETVRNVRRWLERPAYREFQPALLELIERGDTAELTRLFWERIPFGTGGRRGPMAELGSATMNSRTIAESAYGLATYVRQQSAKTDLRVAIAYDTRLRSCEFAEVTASVMAAQGFHVFFYLEPGATPQLSFTVRALECDCGVMISASHNPPSDNGFKAYWSHGGQVLAPHDRGIIDCVDAAEEIPAVKFRRGVETGQIWMLTDAIDRNYASAVCQLSLSSARSIRALYTPLHGVGERSVYRVLQQAGFDGVEMFEPQRSQDGTFPNVPDHLPNPERPAVFGPAIEHAKSAGHHVVLASDPDADRIAVAVRERDGSFTCLTGNQLAALLTHYALAQRQAQGTLSPEHYVIETLVTTPLVAAIAQSFGVDVVRELPVGFKHMAAVVEARGVETFVFATEESVGYMAGDYCRDKDASIGALWALELASELLDQNRTLTDRLRELYGRYGVHVESQLSREFPGPSGVAQIQGLIGRMRDQPPAQWGAMTLERVRDYGRQEIRALPDNRVIGVLPVSAGDLLIVETAAEDCRVQIALRPSGTEPKIKFYFFVQAPPDDDVARRLVQCERLRAAAQSALVAWMG